MSCEIKWASNRMSKTENKSLSVMSVVGVKKARILHESISQHQVTPLVDLKNIAEYLGLVKACAKDESCRLGLNAFKVSGGPYAIARYIAKGTKRDISQMPYSVLTSRESRDEFDQATSSSVIDGNHGRGVAWAASRLGQRCAIHMPVGSTENRRRHTENEGAECTIEKMNYDDCVRMVAGKAKRAECDVVTQDTAWGGYKEIPPWIMQGYPTMTDEAVEQFEERPTRVLIQAGVGSLTGGVVGYFVNKHKKNPPVMVVVKAEPAVYLYKGAETVDGEIRIVDGEMLIITAGLCCDEPNTTSWDILKNHVTAFLAMNNDVARRGTCMLAAPFRGGPQIIPGESGVTTFGTLVTIMKGEACCGLRPELGLDQDSKVLMLSTEGDTDPDRYKTIVWEGGLK